MTEIDGSGEKIRIVKIIEEFLSFFFLFLLNNEFLRLGFYLQLICYLFYNRPQPSSLFVISRDIFFF